MTAHVLIVEDDDDFIDELSAAIGDASPDALITVARGRERACDLLDAEFFDFAILDLNLPTGEHALDTSPDHGMAVFHHARRVAPGLKLFVLTGSPSSDFFSDMMAHKHDADIWSEGRPIATVQFLRKIDLVKAPEIIRQMLDGVGSLDAVELALDGINLAIGQDRLLRILAKRHGAVQCRVTPIGAGKSGALPLRLELYDQHGGLIQQVVAKLGSHHKIEDENRRYDAYVNLLDGAATPRKLALLEYGAGAIAGVFYQLATGFDASLFKLLARDEAQAAAAVVVASQTMEKWSQGAAQERRAIREVRACWVSDNKASELAVAYGLDWVPTFEAHQIQTRWRCVHGDLHGGNVLVSPDGRAVLIDYGDVAHSVGSYDAVTLELSAVLQECAVRSDHWPTLEQCTRWHELDQYVAGCPIPAFIRACRAWATASAAGQREVAVAAYCYLLRQLKYDDTDKTRTLALLQGVRAMYAAT